MCAAALGFPRRCTKIAPEPRFSRRLTPTPGEGAYPGKSPPSPCWPPPSKLIAVEPVGTWKARRIGLRRRAPGRVPTGWCATEPYPTAWSKSVETTWIVHWRADYDHVRPPSASGGQTTAKAAEPARGPSSEHGHSPGLQP
jgi:hypothetical protein